MANVLTDWHKETWSNLFQTYFDTKSVMIPFMNRALEGIMAYQGTVHRRDLKQDFTVEDYVAGVDVTPEDLQSGDDTMVIDQQKSIATKLDTTEVAKLNTDDGRESATAFLNSIAMQKSETHKIAIDRHLLGHYVDAPAANTLGTALAPLALDDTNTYTTIRALATIFDNNNIPDDKRVLIITPQIAENLDLDKDYMTNVNEWRAGLIENRFGAEFQGKKIAGFIPVMSTNVETITAATDYQNLLAFYQGSIFFNYTLSETRIDSLPLQYADIFKSLVIYGSKVFDGEVSQLGNIIVAA